MVSEGFILLNEIRLQ